mgnify:CR=1 FL=1|jgi:hypothetical protein
MRKMPSIFIRDWNGNPDLVLPVQNGECAWVFAGEGAATQKLDGSCCMVRSGRLFKRYDAKRGKTPPAGFEPCGDPDPKTGHHPGWLLVGDGPEDRWHREGLEARARGAALEGLDGVPDGTYELCGPKVQGNPEGYPTHALVPHGVYRYSPEPPRDFDGLKVWLAERNIEGLVWHHSDGRMAKIKASDFGVKRAPKARAVTEANTA